MRLPPNLHVLSKPSSLCPRLACIGSELATCFVAMLLSLTVSLSAQQIGTNKTQDKGSGFTIQVKSQLVVETVVVKDKQGKPINGLTAKDFTLTEDDAPQKIRYCEQQTLPTDAAPLPASKSDDEQIKIYKRLARTQLSNETAGQSQFKDRRLLAFYFDMSAMHPEDQQRALFAAQKFVRTQMTPVDLIAVMRYSGGSVDVLQDFTADRNKLLSILETLVVGEGQGSAELVDDAASADTGAAFGQDSSEFNIFNTDRQLSALQTAARMLGQLTEKKSLLYFSSGLRLNGIDNQAQLRATVDAAVRAGVSFWPIDSRGLVASAPIGDATQGSPGGESMYSGTAAQSLSDSFEHSQDTLFSLAGDTGGKALFNNNDLTQGIRDAQKSLSNYYVLEYYTTNTVENGHFRKVKVTLNNNTEAKLSYREGYYAAKEFTHFTATDKERQLEDALMLGDPITELTVAMELDYFQLNRAEYFVPVVVKIPGRELALAKHGGADHTLIDFVCEIKDDTGGNTVSNLRDNVNIKLTDATAAELSKRPIEYDTGFTLLPGKYTIKLLARDDETGRIGTFETHFVIPNLNKLAQNAGSGRLPISSVVLGSQKVEQRDALYDAEKNKDKVKNDASNPLVQGGTKLIPSVTRVFRTNRLLYVFLQAYGGAVATSPLVASVSLYRDGKQVFSEPPVAVKAEPGSRLGVVPINLQLTLDQLTSGEYSCQVTVLDPAGKRVAFWSAPIVLLQ